MWTPKVVREAHATLIKGLPNENGHPKVAGGLRELIGSDQQAWALRGRESNMG